MEHPTNLMMITSVMMFEDSIDFEQLKVLVEQRMLRFNRFRQRVVDINTTPCWEDDPHFDIRAHVHRVALPAPGDQAALEALVSDMMSTPLNFSRPLWHWHLVEGYNGGCAVISRIHHCIADGIALVHVMLSMTDEAVAGKSMNGKTHASQAASWLERIVRPAASGVGQAVSEGVNIFNNPARILDLMQVGTGSAGAANKLLMMPPDPPTIFKGQLGLIKRAVWSMPIPLSDLKAIGHSTRSTINDVLLSVVSGALRRYMQHRGVPTDNLNIRAVIPVNLRPLAETPTMGNRFGLVFLSLPIGMEHPIDRLVELQTRMDDIKGSPEAMVAFGLLNVMGMVPRRIENLILKIFGTKATAVMTNVPGPRETLTMAGKNITGMMFWVPQSGRLGLGVSILSYAGEVRLGIATDVGLVPDPDVIVQAFNDEFERFRAMVHRVEEAKAEFQAKQK